MIDPTLVLTFLVVAQMLYIVHQDNSHRRERKDYYDRLMSKSFDEYTRNTAGKTKAPVGRSAMKANLEEDLIRNGIYQDD